MRLKTRFLISVAAVAALSPAIAPASAQSISSFTEGDVVVSVEGNGGNTGSYTDNQAAPLTLYEYGSNGSGFVGSFALPQTASGANSAVSGEYGSSSEGTLQLSGNGRYLTIMGYGVNAKAFNANPGSFSPDPTNIALGQSGSQTGQSYTAVPRVVALDRAERLGQFFDRAFQRFQRQQPAQRLYGRRNVVLCLGPGHLSGRDRRGVLRDPWKPFRDFDHRRGRRRRHIAGHPRGAGLQRPALCLRPTARRARPIAITSARSARKERCRPAKPTAAMAPQCCRASATPAAPARSPSRRRTPTTSMLASSAKTRR